MIGFWVAKSLNLGTCSQFCFSSFVTVNPHLCVSFFPHVCCWKIHKLFPISRGFADSLHVFSMCLTLETSRAMDDHWKTTAGSQLAEDLRSSLRRRWVQMGEELYVFCIRDSIYTYIMNVLCMYYIYIYIHHHYVLYTYMMIYDDMYYNYTNRLLYNYMYRGIDRMGHDRTQHDKTQGKRMQDKNRQIK